MLNNNIPISELYKFNKKAAIRRVYRESSIPDVIPTVDSISQLYSELSNSSNPIAWDHSPEIIPAATTFDFSCPTSYEIVRLLKKGKKENHAQALIKLPMLSYCQRIPR